MATTSPRVFFRPTKRHLIAIVLAVAVAAGVGATVRPAHAAEAPVNLGTAGSYGVLGGTTITNTGPSAIGGDLGLHPGSGVTGFPPGLVGGATHAADAAALQAQSDLTIAYDDAASRAATLPAISWTELGNQSFVPGVYEGGALTITGDVTLVGDADSVFIFRANSSIVTASGSRVLLSGPINPCNVFWQIDSTVTLGSNSTMAGTMMALTSINAATGASVAGRLLARNGAVTLDSNVISRPLSCGADAALAPDFPSAPPAIAVPGKATFAG